MIKQFKKIVSRKNKAKNSKEAEITNPFVFSTVMNIACVWLAACLLGAFLMFVYLPQDNDRRLKVLSQAFADQQASNLDSAISQYELQLATLVKREDVIAAASSADDEWLVALGEQLNNLQPHSASLHLIALGKLGIAEIKHEKFKPRNNIEIDMIRKASMNEKVSVEIYRSDNEWLISFVQPILKKYNYVDELEVTKEDKTVQTVKPQTTKTIVIGAAILTLKHRFILSSLSHFDQTKGESNLILKGRQDRTILRQGDSGNTNYLGSTKLRKINLQIDFAPSRQVVLSNRATPEQFGIAILITAVLISLVILLRHRTSVTVFTHNVEQLLNYSTSLKTKETVEAPVFTLSQFKEIAVLAAQLRLIGGSTDANLASNEKAGSVEELTVDESSLDELELPLSAAPLLDEEMADEEVLDLDEVLDLEEIVELDDTLEVADLEIPAINEQIFRAYDIRGIAASDLNENVVYLLGMAIGSEAQSQQQQEIIVGYDGRHSSPGIKEALCKGLTETGINVIDIGLVPTPLVYFATHHLNTQSGIVVTGSHNPPEYNGLKIVIAGKTLTGEELKQLRQRIISQDFKQGQGSIRQEDISDDYIETVISDVAIAQPLKVVIDCGNGAASELAPRLIQELGCEVVPLFCEIDGDFPNHHPDPSIMSNLTALVHAVQTQGADLGIAFDGDGDRLGVVSGAGNIILPDRLLMLFAQDVVSRNPGADVIFDVKCTRHLNGLISSYGGRPIMWKSGHSYIKEKMQETGALLGGELSGHIFFKERWYGFDDGIYSAARLIEILSTTDTNLDSQLSSFPSSWSTPELQIPIADDLKFQLMSSLAKQNNFDGAKISDLDGIKADFPDGWGLVRASNTTQALTLRFEADTEEALHRIQNLFKEQLSMIDNTLTFPF